MRSTPTSSWRTAWIRPSGLPPASAPPCPRATSGTAIAELLVDTDVCIAHLAGERRLPRQRGRLSHSVITRAELLAGAAEHEASVRRLLAGMREIPVDRRIADRA